MDVGNLILRRVVGTVVSRTIPAIRTARARLARGRCFSLPAGKTYVLLPQAMDYENAAPILEMLEHLWYQRDRDWELIRTGDGVPLDDSRRRCNLIVLGGPDQNPVSRELMQKHPQLFQSVYYQHGYGTPEFQWMNRAFRANGETDFAVLAVKHNVLTDEPNRRLVLIFGLGQTGTLAAARLYAATAYRRERRDLQREAGTLKGNLEALLHVDHSGPGAQVNRVRAARRDDGDALPPHAGAVESVPFFKASLSRIYDSLEQHRRQILLSDLRFRLTITHDFSLRVEEEVSIAAERQDIVVFAKKLRGTPLEPGQSVGFVADTVDGGADLVHLLAEALPAERRFLLFPLPPLAVGDPARRVRLSAEWPRACSGLSQAGQEDWNSVEVSEHASTDVDMVSVTIRFEVQDAAFQVFERFSLENALPDAPNTGSRGRTYDLHTPYHLRLRNVPAGRILEFRIVRLP